MDRSEGRADAHADRLIELQRPGNASRERRVHFRKFLPTHRDPGGIVDWEVMVAVIGRYMAEAQDQGSQDQG